MATINFTQFATPTDTYPNNDYVVGYNRINGTNVEAKWNLYNLATEMLPRSGLSTRLHQIRMLAHRNYEATYSCAAVTRKEEVVCWGQNAYGTVGTSVPSDQQHTKFGAGHKSTTRASAWQPVLIPFLVGQPNDPNQDIYDLQKNNLTIAELHWDQWSSIARLSDGSVWIKALLGSTRNNGIATSSQPSPTSAHFFSAAYYKISIWTVVGNGSNMIAKAVGSCPVGSTVNGGIYWAIDQNDDLHIWGEGVAGTNVFNGQATQSIPINITNSDDSTKQNVRHARIVSGGVGTNEITIQVITKDNKLFSLGSNRFGIFGNKTTTGATSWTRGRYKTINQAGATENLIDNAQSFVDSAYQANVAGYFSIADGSNTNRIFICGHNKSNGSSTATMDLIAIDGVAQPTTPSAASGARCVYVPIGSISSPNDMFNNGFINNSLTLVVLTSKGYVYCAGKNGQGEAGTTNGGSILLGAAVTPPIFKKDGNSQVYTFGDPAGGLSAIDVYWDRTASTDQCTAIKAVNAAGKSQVFLAGYRTFANQYQSFATIDAVFRLLPIKENITDVLLGGDPIQHQYNIILTDTGRTYGNGYGPHGLLSDSIFSVYASSWSYSVFWTNSWSPQLTILF